VWDKEVNTRKDTRTCERALTNVHLYSSNMLRAGTRDILKGVCGDYSPENVYGAKFRYVLERLTLLKKHERENRTRAKSRAPEYSLRH